jgi:hypothetical protein
MRKGRSQRKPRGSLPSTSIRPPARLAGSAAPSSAGPQVVVGHAAPRAEEYVDGTSRHAEALADLRETRSERERNEPPAAVAKLELAEHDEPTHDEPTHDEPTHDEPELEQTARVETLTFAVVEAPSSDFDDPSDDAESVNAQTTAPGKAESRSSHVTSLPTPEEMSIPPMGDLSVEPIADRFFSEGELVAARADHEAEEWDERAHNAVRKSLPEVVQRRARFAKYVRWAVGGAAVLCLAAVARSALPPSAHSSASASSDSTALSQSTGLEAPASKAASVAVVAAVTTAEPVSAPVVAVPAAVAPAAAPAPEPVKGAEPEAAAAPVAPATPVSPAAAAPGDAPAAPAVATSDKTALQEKNDSRRALERGKLADAIAAGERSVALDPTDGEAWLLLGAAYQEKGKNADARRCYSSCVKEGKRGPLGECRALIH